MRIVMFVLNDARTDARVLREATSLSAAGHQVTIMARPSDPGASEDERDIIEGIEVIRVVGPHRWRFYWTWLRYPWRLRHWWVGRIGAALRRPPIGLVEVVALGAAALVSVPWMLIRLPFFAIARRRPPSLGGSTLDWLVRWRFIVLGWANRAAAAAPPADAWHGHDLTGLEAAGRARRARGGLLVYDSHEIYLESGSNATRPRWLKWFLARSERRWSRDAVALVTVNRSLADELGRRLRPRRTVVVHNAPERWDPPVPRPDLIREATGIMRDSPIALYHGGFSAYRGMEQIADSILEQGLEKAHAVYLGYGSQRPALERLTKDPRYGGRLHVLDAVPPNTLPPWIASADVGVMPIQPSTLNHRLSTPNKLFESLAAGLPVVVSDFIEMRDIVLGDPLGPLGEVCRPDDPADIARAIRVILQHPADEREALRARCLAAAHARWNWDTEVGGLLDLYATSGPAT
jgi:glycosyltransferase involved in cell wall biosynthesis